jgi:heme/copper-type cytochrome/quinol oxidase subunit 1
VATIEHLELVATIGNGLLVLAGLLFILLLLRAATGGVPAGDDPWSGHTLEWATTSPPKVSSEAPLYDARHRPEEADA